MFDLPRSTWDDYNKSLISEGGGVYGRGQKSIPISPQVRAALGSRTASTNSCHRTVAPHPEGAGGSAVERRHRHLHQGGDGVRRRRRRPCQRHDPGEREIRCAPCGRRGRQPG